MFHINGTNPISLTFPTCTATLSVATSLVVIVRLIINPVLGCKHHFEVNLGYPIVYPNYTILELYKKSRTIILVVLPTNPRITPASISFSVFLSI